MPLGLEFCLDREQLKIYINRQPVNGPWGGGNAFFRAFHKIVPQLEHKLLNPDIVFVAGLDVESPHGISIEDAVRYKELVNGHRSVKIVLRVNENDARKGTNNVDKRLLWASRHIDGTVFVSNWLRDYFLVKNWVDKNHTVIVNGVDSEIFRSQPKLNNGKVNIVAHHWSDNYMKGFDIYDKLDEFVGRHPDKFAFTYIGRDRGSFKNTSVIKPLSGKPLGEELGKHDVYVSASRCDPGPNHVVEAVSCELPTYVYEHGGGCVEFAGSDHVYSNWNELEQILHIGQFSTNSVEFSDWQSCIQKYVDFFNQTLRSQC